MSKTQATDVMAKLDRKQFPVGEQPEINFTQEFLLQAPGAEDLTIAPLLFHQVPLSAVNYHSPQCGVFFLKTSGESHYVPVIDQNYQYPEVCSKVLAVGAMNDPGSRPRLIFLFEVVDGSNTNLHNSKYRVPSVLIWDAASGKYKLDKATFAWLSNEPSAQTVAGVRSLLARRH